MLGACDGGASCAYTNTIAWRTPTTPLPIENDPRAVFERLFGTSGSTDRGGAAGAHPARPEHPRLRRQRSRAASQRVIGPQDKDEARPSTSTRCATSSAASRWPRSRTRASCRSSISRSAIPGDYAEHAKLMMDLLALAYQTDLTRVSTFMLAQRGQRPGLSRRSACRLAPSAVASPGRAGQARAAAQDQRVPLPAVRVSGHEARRRCRRATARCSTTRCSSTAPASATATRTSTTTCRSRWSAAQAAGIKGGRYVRYAKGTPLANLHVTVLDKLGVQVEKFGDSTGTWIVLSMSKEDSDFVFSCFRGSSFRVFAACLVCVLAVGSSTALAQEKAPKYPSLRPITSTKP